MSWKQAVSLSKAEVAAAEPPGTVRLVDHTPHQHASGSPGHSPHIQLIPQPSPSPADPYNWPRWRKLAVLATASLYAFSASMQSGILGPAITLIHAEVFPEQPLYMVSRLISVNVLCIGLSNIFWVPLGNTFGRRPVLIVGALVMTLGALWAGLASSFNSLLAARVVQGIGGGPGDSIAPDLIGEVFFVHQRGRAMAVYTVFLAGGSLFAGIVGGYTFVNAGYAYLFWIPMIVAAFTLVCEVLLVPETLFDREAGHSGRATDSMILEKDAAVIQTDNVGSSSSERPFTYRQSLRLGAVYRGNLLGNFAAPWRTLRLPGTWIVCLHYGGLLGGLVTISLIGPVILSEPPFLWGANVGLFSIASLIGGLLGGLFTYVSVDRLVLWKSSRTGGLVEPEDRLPAMFPALAIATAGMWVFGFSAANHHPKAWIGMCFGFGMNAFGVVQIPSVGFNYLIESYNAVSGDCFVMTTIARAAVSFAWTFFVVDWIEEVGPAEPFGIFGMLMGVFALLTIPLWVFGKRARIATAIYLPEHAHH